MTATPRQVSIALGLAQVPETQNSEVYGEAIRMYNAIHTMAAAVDVYTGLAVHSQTERPQVSILETVRSQNIDRVYAVCVEAVSVGQICSFVNASGYLGAILAQDEVTRTRRPRAVATGTYAIGEWGEFLLHGACPFFSGLTTGQQYYMSTAAGAITATATGTGAPARHCVIGYALSSSILYLKTNGKFELV